MSDSAKPAAPPTPPLVVRRTIKAGPERVFEAWTRPELLLAWWGPRPVRCSGAEVDLRVGGRYRIDNQLPDGALGDDRGRVQDRRSTAHARLHLERQTELGRSEPGHRSV